MIYTARRLATSLWLLWMSLQMADDSIVRSAPCQSLKLRKGAYQLFLNLYIRVTCLAGSDVTDVLDRSVCRYISLHDSDKGGQKIQRDIKDSDYIKSVIITRPEKGRWKAERKLLVVDILKKESDGILSVDAGFLTTLSQRRDG
jgi:hypothetical protein